MGQIEGAILLWIQDNLRSDFLTPVMKFITSLGNAGAIWIVLTIILLCIPKYRKTGLLAAIALLSTLLIDNVLLKNLVARTRPYEVIDGLRRLIEAQKDYSFPSGHTGSSLAAAVIFFIYLPRRYGIPALILAFMIGFSRLYLGVHYVSDVLGGAFIGVAIALCIWKVERYHARGQSS